ncbi:chromosome segregation in meiosis-related protein [Rhodotorula kratochvilovae]
MSSSDLDLDAPDESTYVSEKQRAKSQRRDALARLKGGRSSTRPQPSFLGAGNDDDAAADDAAVDFDQWERRDLQRRNKRAAAPAASGREPDPVLSHAFDDLFDLGDDGIRTGEQAGADNVDGAADVDGVDADGAQAKKRRVVAKMDETRLLGPNGFPKLRDDLKKVRIKGKGHEMQDLKRVLSTYQLWAHQMYPKTNFRDTLQTVEKLCRKRTVQRALKEYRDDEKHGRSARDEARENDAFADLDLPTTGVAASAAAAPPATMPKRADLLADAGFDDDDDDLFADEEALLAELEAEATATAAARASAPAPTPAAADAPRAKMQLIEEVFDGLDEVDEDAEAEAALREAEELLM